MIEYPPDWCISRQRSWGVPIPAFVCGSCGFHIMTPEIVARVRDKVGESGSGVWFEKPIAELLPENFGCPRCVSKNLDKDGSILDVWFESGSSWQAMLVADHRLSLPADLYVEGNDQHRGWFQLSMLLALAMHGNAPY